MTIELIKPGNEQTAIEKVLADFFELDEDQSKRFAKFFGSRKARHLMTRERLKNIVQNSVFLSGDMIDASACIQLIHPEDQALAGDIARFVGEYLTNNTAYLASRLTVAQYRAMLIRRLFQAGFCK